MTKEQQNSIQRLQDKIVNFTELFFHSLNHSEYDKALFWSERILSHAEDLKAYAEHQIGAKQ